MELGLGKIFLSTYPGIFFNMVVVYFHVLSPIVKKKNLKAQKPTFTDIVLLCLPIIVN